MDRSSTLKRQFKELAPWPLTLRARLILSTSFNWVEGHKNIFLRILFLFSKKLCFPRFLFSFFVEIYCRIYSWGRERYVVETKLTHGMQSFGSVRGVSGHQHNPFAGNQLHTHSECINVPHRTTLNLLNHFYSIDNRSTQRNNRRSEGLLSHLQWELPVRGGTERDGQTSYKHGHPSHGLWMALKNRYYKWVHIHFNICYIIWLSNGYFFLLDRRLLQYSRGDTRQVQGGAGRYE